MALLSKNQPQLSEDRVKAFRAELDAWIDARAAEITKECPGVPIGSIRNSITRGLGCQCAAYLEIAAKEKAA